MKTIRLENGVVAEIIPEYALPVEKWYGEEFAGQCVEASDTVKQGMVYDPVTKTFSDPVIPAPQPTTEERLAAAETAITVLMGV